MGPLKEVKCFPQVYYQAKELALQNQGRFHVAAILKRKKSYLQVRTNRKKTHPRAIHPKPDGQICRSMHAEHSALRWAKPGDVLYVIRFTKDGTVTMAKPCPKCVECIQQAGVSTVYYTNREGQWEKLEL